MQKAEYLAVLRADADALPEAARLGLTAGVPSCPGWNVADLVIHTGGVLRSQAEIVARRAQEPPAMNPEMFASVPGLLPWVMRSALMGETSDLAALPPGMVEWFEDGARMVLEALAAADLDEPVWSWSADRTVRHYLRMVPIEAAVHR